MSSSSLLHALHVIDIKKYILRDKGAAKSLKHRQKISRPEETACLDLRNVPFPRFLPHQVVTRPADRYTYMITSHRTRGAYPRNYPIEINSSIGKKEEKKNSRIYDGQR